MARENEILHAGSDTATAGLIDVLKSLPTSTAHQARLQLYQPTRRPSFQERTITNAWGTATIRGCLGQAHADVVEAICRNALDYREVPQTGHLQVLVDPFAVRTSVGGGSAYSLSTLWKLLRDLRESSLTLEAPSLGMRVLGGILDRVEESQATTRNPFTKRPRALWRVTFDPAFAVLFKEDLRLHYDPAELATFRTGVAQAIARHILTHKKAPNGGWRLDSLIELVGAGGDLTTVRNRRRDLRSDAENLARVGIVLDGDRVLKE